MSIQVVEIQPGSPAARQPLEYAYRTDSHYALTVERREKGWHADFALKFLPAGTVTKSFRSELFKSYIERPRAFAALCDDRPAAFMQLGFEDWSNRLRIWELLVLEPFRRRRIGAALVATAEEVARSLGARALVLETQSCNVPAISFYLREGFDLVGFDATHYSDADIERGEVRLEMGRRAPYEARCPAPG